MQRVNCIALRVKLHVKLALCLRTEMTRAFVKMANDAVLHKVCLLHCRDVSLTTSTLLLSSGHAQVHVFCLTHVTTSMVYHQSFDAQAVCTTRIMEPNLETNAQQTSANVGRRGREMKLMFQT